MFIVTVGFKRNVHREFHQHSLQQTGIQDNTIIVLHSSSIDRRFTNSNWALIHPVRPAFARAVLVAHANVLWTSRYRYSADLPSSHSKSRVHVHHPCSNQQLSVHSYLNMIVRTKPALHATIAIFMFYFPTVLLSIARPLQNDAPSLHMHEFSFTTYDIAVDATMLHLYM